MAERVYTYDDDDFEILCDASSIPIPPTFESHECKTPTLTNMNCMVEKTITNDNQMIKEGKSSLTMSFYYLPPRYGSAADIPYDEGFDLKSILNSKPAIPSNDIMNVLNNNNNNNNKLQQKQQQHSSVTNNLNELLISYARDRENLLQKAKQAQQDFINAMDLD